jgi:hypothetical protein
MGGNARFSATGLMATTVHRRRRGPEREEPTMIDCRPRTARLGREVLLLPFLALASRINSQQAAGLQARWSSVMNRVGRIVGKYRNTYLTPMPRPPAFDARASDARFHCHRYPRLAVNALLLATSQGGFSSNVDERPVSDGASSHEFRTLAGLLTQSKSGIITVASFKSQLGSALR